MAGEDVDINVCAEKIISDFSAQKPIRAGSFIITLYGDALLPRNAGIWTGYIIDLCKQLKITESLVRTTLSRLVASRRLVGAKVGRKSYYHLSDKSHDEFQVAAKRLYSGKHETGNIWTFVLNLDPSRREEIKRGLERQGFGAPAHGLYMKPGDCRKQLGFSFGGDLSESGNIIFVSTIEDALARPVNVQLLSTAWDVDIIHKSYTQFCAKFTPLYQCIKEGQKLDGRASFFVRQILVHEYRLIALKDPWLPSKMLPVDWVGYEGFDLFSGLYQSLVGQSEEFLDDLLVDIDSVDKVKSAIMDERLVMLSARTLK